MKKLLFRSLGLVLALVLLQGCGDSTDKANARAKGVPKEVRLGYFANITHAQALIGVSRGDFQKAVAPAELKTVVYNAGPSAIEAFFANKLDIAYIGPGPAVNAFVNSQGKAVRIVSGSAANGVSIVVSPASGITKLDDLKGKRIATPQHANTQDIALRAFVKERFGDKDKKEGGTTDIQPVANADQIGLFKQGRLDASWAPEPWATRLIHEAGAKLLEEEKNLWPEKKFTITLILVSNRFLDEYPETVAAFLRAHTDLTDLCAKSPDQAASLANAELQKLLGKPLSPEVLKEAFGRVEFTTEALPATIEKMAQWNFDVGFIKEKPDLKGLFETPLKK